MRTLLVPADASACRFYRLKAPGEAAQALGVDVTLAEPLHPSYRPLGGEAPLDLDVGDAEVIVLHRPVFAVLVDRIAVWQSEGRAVVVDVDDDLLALHPAHGWSRKGRGKVWAQEQARAAMQADLVTCGTPALAERYGLNGRSMVLPNCVPARLLEMPRSSDGYTMGWAGSAKGHPGDLPVTGGAVADVLMDTPWKFKVVGPADAARAELGLTSDPIVTDGLCFEDYLTELGSLDIAICPLAGTPFNRAKSRLKILECAARGAKVVASPTPEYVAMAVDGLAILAATPREWRRALKGCMKYRDLHAEEVVRAQERIAHYYTYETQGSRWCEAWSQALTNHRGGS